MTNKGQTRFPCAVVEINGKVRKVYIFPNEQDMIRHREICSDFEALLSARQFYTNKQREDKTMHGLTTIVKQNETKTITVTIGRNIGSSPMDSQRWWNFQHRLLKIGEIGKVYFAGSSDSGKWEMEMNDGRWQGITEDNFNVVFSVVAGNIPQVKDKLTKLKVEYEQDAIALTIGSTELI